MTLADVPHDVDVEAQVLGACLAFPRALGQVGDVLIAADFYRPDHGNLFAVLSAVYAGGGDPTRPVEVTETARLSGIPVDSSTFVTLMAQATGSWVRGAEVVARLAALRRLQSTASAVVDACGDLGSDPAGLVDGLRSDLDAVDVPLGRPSKDLWALEDFTTTERPQVPWVVPGLLGRQHRAIVVAPEGTSKTACLRQIALLSSQGLHPFTLRPMTPVRVLMADFENPEDSVIRYSRPILRDLRLRQAAAFDGDRVWIWHRPGGIDLRSRVGRSEFEANVAKVRPDLVTLGPLYKTYRATAKENDELAAGEVQAVLDDLRSRHGFALLIEHHAPHGTRNREMRPIGSSAWLRWPEFGLGFTASREEKGALDVSHWRGDRIEAAWPDRLDLANSGVPWRWSAHWEGGMPGEAEPEEAF